MESELLHISPCRARRLEALTRGSTLSGGVRLHMPAVLSQQPLSRNLERLNQVRASTLRIVHSRMGGMMDDSRNGWRP